MSRFAVFSLVCLGVLVIGVFAAFNLARFTDAYVALEAAEIAHPVRGAQAERLRLAQAMAESEAPRGMPMGARIHPVGTLAHLRYETLDRVGQVTSTIEVRALVPSLPAFGEDAPGGPHGEIECPEVCRSALGPSAAHLIARGGTPGLSPEWVMRMPVGQAFEIPRDSFTFQDVEDRRPISLPVARYRVTLLEACPARVRMGTVRSIDYFPHAIVPIPRGIRTSRWVQVDGCSPLLTRKVARPEPPAPPLNVAKGPAAQPAPAPKLGIVVPRREGRLGLASLVVDEGAKLEHPEDVHVRFLAACRFDVAAQAWIPLPVPDDALEVSGPGLMNRIRVAYRFPEQRGFYWARWTETHKGAAEEVRTYSVAVPLGSVQSEGLPDPEGGCGNAAAIAR